MRPLLLILILFLSTITKQFYAQNLDSLFKVYNDKTKPDTERLKAIDVIALSFKNNNPDTTIILAEQQLKLANSVSNCKIWAF